MKRAYSIFILLLFVTLVSCDNNRIQKKLAESFYNDVKSSNCIETFCGYDIMKRGKMFVFFGYRYQIVTHLINDSLSIDTIMNRDVSLYNIEFSKVDTMDIIGLSKVAQCFEVMNASWICGFSSFTRITINDHLTMYYISNIELLENEMIQLIEERAIKLDNKWYYVIKK